MAEIRIQCATCFEFLDTPEVLCEHMEMEHGVGFEVEKRVFESFTHYQIWLSKIEDSRSDGGGYLGSSQGPALCEDEYYLLCRRQSPSPTAKRRRMSEDACCSNSGLVTCTAFVHVCETTDGRVTVVYCLDHCGHAAECAEGSTQTSCATSRNKRDSLKRSSPCSSTCEDDSSIDSEDDMMEEINNNVDKMCSINTLISQRLDTTADKLKRLTKVLEELAFDIRIF